MSIAWTAWMGSCPCKACQTGGLPTVKVSALGTITRTARRTDGDRRLARLQRRHSRGTRQRTGRRG